MTLHLLKPFLVPLSASKSPILLLKAAFPSEKKPKKLQLCSTAAGNEVETSHGWFEVNQETEAAAVASPRTETEVKSDGGDDRGTAGRWRRAATQTWAEEDECRHDSDIPAIPWKAGLALLEGKQQPILRRSAGDEELFFKIKQL